MRADALGFDKILDVESSYMSGLTASMASCDTFGAPGNVTRTTLMLSLLFCMCVYSVEGESE